MKAIPSRGTAARTAVIGLAALFAVLCAPLAATAPNRPAAGDFRIGFALTDDGFCGLETTVAYAPMAGLWTGLALRISALTLLRGEADTGEAALTGEWAADADFDLRLSCEAGVRFQGQSLGRVTSFFTEESVKAGFPGERWSAGLMVARRDAWITRTVFSEWASSTFDDRYPGCSAAPKSVTVLFAGGATKFGAYGELAIPGNARVSLAAGARIPDTPFVSGFDGMMFGVFPFFADISWSMGL